MTDTTNLALPLIQGAQAQKHVTHNEALRVLDTLVQLAVLDRDLNAPPAAPTEGQRWIVKASPAPTGAWANHGNQIAAWQDAAWQFSAPKMGWVAYVADEGALLAWNGTAWVDALALLSAWQNLTLLGIGTSADASNPLSAKLNNTLFTAKTVAEGGSGDLRYKLSKESAAKALAFLFQDNFSGRAEIGLTGDDDFHFKVSADGSSWIEALLLDRTTGAAKFNSQFLLSGDVSPAQITSNQNDYNPANLATSSILRINSDASRQLTGLQGGADGRIIGIINAGANNIFLKNEDAGSTAANRLALGGADLLLTGNEGVALWYDATSSRWRLLAAGTSCARARAWWNFNGTGVVALRDSHNVSSITDVNVGVYLINFTTAVSNANYSFVGGAGLGGTRCTLDLVSAAANSALAAKCAVSDGAAAGSPLVDADIITGVVFAR
jgi:hypothetical protein